MDYDDIIQTLKHDNSSKLQLALNVVMTHIQYCKYYNIDMFQDPLLSRVLIFG